MKTFINKIKLSVIALSFIFLNSCSSDESVSSKIQTDVTAGAILRTIKVNQTTFNFLDPSAKWSVTLEYQDAANGSLLAEVKVYARQTTGGVNKTEKFVKSIPASAFTAGPNGYLRGDATASLAEVLTALGLTAGQYAASDTMRMRLELVLTDGRKFSSTDIAPTLTGSYFKSPFQYAVQFFCPLTNASSFNGNYKVAVDGWEDYAIGGSATVAYNPADGVNKFRILSDLNPSCFNPGAWYILVTVDFATGKITNAVTVGFELYRAGGTQYTVTAGTGTVGTCTGDIALSATWGGNGTYGFTLLKQ